MRLEDSEVITTIAEAGSIRLAADLLGRSQPGLTKILRRTEETIGFPIFERTARGVVPTEQGRAILYRLTTIQNEFRRMQIEIASIRNAHEGTLTLCISPLAAIEILPAALRQFHQVYPNIAVRVVSGTYPSSLPLLHQGKVDLMIGPAPPGDMANGLSLDHLFDSEIAVVTAKSSPLAKAGSLAELVEAKWIMIGTEGGPGDIFAGPFRKLGLEPPRALVRSDSYFGAMAIVASLQAVCTFPAGLLPLADPWGICAIRIREEIAPLSICNITRSRQPFTAPLDYLVNSIHRRVNTMRSEMALGTAGPLG
ncbi:LysR substrate-binding domain-containing protein [Paracoccus sp. (in: a-proteobacteria)]|uniref:LysR family transcriptional regulator n=1 Tax=Paracoccus sp. TaxID=267 RepID=UPI003A8AF7CC